MTVFGWAFAIVTLRLSFPTDNDSFQTFVKYTITAALLVSALLVLFGTKGKHPGWLGLAVAAVLMWIS